MKITMTSSNRLYIEIERELAAPKCRLRMRLPAEGVMLFSLEARRTGELILAPKIAELGTLITIDRRSG